MGAATMARANLLPSTVGLSLLMFTLVVSHFVVVHGNDAGLVNLGSSAVEAESGEATQVEKPIHEELADLKDKALKMKAGSKEHMKALKKMDELEEKMEEARVQKTEKNDSAK